MVEATPRRPYSGYAIDLLRVERNMRLRRRRLLTALRDDEIAPTVATFPLLGALGDDGTVPPTKVGGPRTESEYIGDGIKGNMKILKAYSTSNRRVEEQERKYVAFSLLSAGAFRGSNRTIYQVLNITVQDVRECGYKGLREVHFYGYTANECLKLVEVAYMLGLVQCG